MGSADTKLIIDWCGKLAMRIIAGLFCFNIQLSDRRSDQCDNLEMMLGSSVSHHILKPYWMEIYICPLWPLVDPCCWLDTDTWLNTTEEDIQAENGIFSTIYLGNYTMTGNKKFLRRYTCKIIKLGTASAHLCTVAQWGGVFSSGSPGLWKVCSVWSVRHVTRIGYTVQANVNIGQRKYFGRIWENNDNVKYVLLHAQLLQLTI